MTAKEFAIKCHADTNHSYDGKPYEAHLQMVVDYAMKYAHLCPYNKELIAETCWLHDTIEDTRQTYNDILRQFGPVLADAVYALTNEKGRNRKERANEKYYLGIKNNSIAHFVKLCDRLANIEYSRKTGSKMIEAYRKEHPDFEDYLSSFAYTDMFREMTELLSENLACTEPKPFSIQNQEV